MIYRQIKTSSEHGDAVILDELENPVIGLHGEIELRGINVVAISSPTSDSDICCEQELCLLQDGDHKGIHKRYDEDIQVTNSSESHHRSSNHPFLSYPYILEYLYPPDQPVSLQLWHSSNLALPMSYLLVGALQGLSSGVMTMFLLQIGANEAQQTTIISLRSLPATMKIVFGFISDSFPLFGYRRKLYMILGWAISSIAMLALFFIEYTISDREKSSQRNIIHVALLYFCFGFGFWFADVVADSIMAEKSKLETTHNRGQLQSTCYACRYFALMVSITFSTFLYDKLSPAIIFLCMGILPWLTAIPATFYMAEEQIHIRPSITALCHEVWTTVCSQAAWQPMAFVFIYISLQVGNAAWQQYLYTVLKFTSMEINSLMVVSYILLYVGVMIYKTYLRNMNFRYIYISSSLLRSFFSVIQIMLILQINRAFGISNYLFSLGDNALDEFVYGIQYLPTMIMMAQLCPVGSEGTTYAMFTSVNNSAILVASALSTKLLSIWDVSKATLAEGNLSGLLKLTILTSAIKVFAIMFVGLLPAGIDELKALDHERKSKIGGFIFMLVISVAILFTIVNSLLNVLAPGWSGES